MNKIILLFIILMSTTLFLKAQEVSDVQENQYIKVTARAAITPKGVKGYVKVTNTTNETIYVYGAGASVSVQKITETKEGDKSTWLTKNLSISNLFLGPGKSVVDNDAASDLGNAYYNNLRNLKLNMGRSGVISRKQPNANCFNLKVGTTSLFTIDGLKYSVIVYSSESNKYVGSRAYYARLIVENPTANTLEFSAPVVYKMYYNNYSWSGEAKYKKVKAFNNDEEVMQTIYATETPTMFIEFINIPGIYGVSTGNQVSKITVPVYQNSGIDEPTQRNSSVANSTPTQVFQSSVESYLLIDSDVSGTLTLDGSDQRKVEEGQSLKVSVGPGEHLVKLVSSIDPTVTYSQVVEAKEGAQKVVLIKLMTPQLQEKKRQAAVAEQQAKAKKEEAERLSVGTVLITSDIPVTLELDGNFIGTSNSSKSVKAETKPGEHLLRIIPDQLPANSYSETIVIKGGTQIVKSLQLKEKFGQLLSELEDKKQNEAAIELEKRKIITSTSAALIGKWTYQEDKQMLTFEFKSDNTGTVMIKSKRKTLGSKYDFIFVTWTVSDDGKKILMDDKYSSDKPTLEILSLEPGKKLTIKDEDGVELTLQIQS